MLDATATAQPTQSDFVDSAPESSHGIAPVVMGAEQAKVESNAPEETSADSSSANPVTSLPQVAAVAAAPSGAELGAAQTLVDANQWRAAVIAEYDAAVRASGAAVAVAPGGVPQHRPPPLLQWMMLFTSNITSNLLLKDTTRKLQQPMLNSMRYSMLKANSELPNFGCEGEWLSVSKTA